MKKNLTGYVSKYLNNRIRRKHFLLALSVLSICTVAAVYSTLLLPAFSMVYNNINLDSEQQKCVFGGTLTANVSANVKADQSDKVFLITSVCSEAGLGDKYIFSDNVTQITTENDELLELHKFLNKDGDTAYWFSLPPDKSADFNLDFVSDKNADNAPEGSEASVVLYSAYADTLDEAQNLYDSEKFNGFSDDFLAFTWMTQADFEKMQSEIDLNATDENFPLSSNFETLQSFGAGGSDVSLNVSKTIDYLGDGATNADTTLSGNDNYRLYMNMVNTMTTSAPTDLLLVVDRSGSMQTTDMTNSSGTSISRSQAVVNLLNGENETGFIQKFLSLNASNKIAVTWFAGTTTISASTTAGVAKNWTSSNFTVDSTTDLTTNNAGHLGYFSSGGGTNYMCGLWQAVDTLKTVANDGNQKVMIFLSDGVPTYCVYNSSSTYDYPNISTMATYANHVSTPTGSNMKINGDGTQTAENMPKVSMFSKASITDFKANIPSGTIVYSISYGANTTYRYTSVKSEAEGYDSSNPDDTTQATYNGKLVWVVSSGNANFQLATSKPTGYVAAYVKETHYNYTIDPPSGASQATAIDAGVTKYVWMHNETRGLAYSTSSASQTSFPGFSPAYTIIPIYTKDQPSGASQATSGGTKVWISTSTGQIAIQSYSPGGAYVAAYEQPVNYLLNYVTYNGGQMYNADNTDSLYQSMQSIVTSVPVKNVVMTDNLSLNVGWYGTLPDLKITRVLKNNSSATPVVLWSSSGAAASGTIGAATSYNTDNGTTIIQGVTYTSSTGGVYSGSVVVTFNPNFVVDSAYLYELSFNVRTSDYAYHNYADSGGYGGTVGDANTDYLVTSNSTSSGKAGFYSNYSAQATYTSNGTSYTTTYPKPVVQVTPATLSLLKTNLSASPLQNIEFKLFNATVVGSTWTQGAQYGSTLTTSSTGNLSFTGIRPGTYLLYETRAKTGYNLPETPWKFTVTNTSGTISTTLLTYSGSTVSSSSGIYKITNSGNYTLPCTGGDGVLDIYMWGGAIVMCGGIGLYLKNRRRSCK